MVPPDVRPLALHPGSGHCEDRPGRGYGILGAGSQMGQFCGKVRAGTPLSEDQAQWAPRGHLSTPGNEQAVLGHGAVAGSRVSGRCWLCSTSSVHGTSVLCNSAP